MSNRHQPYLSTLLVKVPASTRWEPRIAEQFMISLYAIQDPFALAIHATARAISWHITVPQTSAQAVTNTLFALHPAAEVTSTHPPQLSGQFWTFHFEVVNPFVLPLKHAQDFVGIDPISSVVTSLGNLNPDEEAIYELLLSPTDKKTYKLGKDLISQSRHKWYNLIPLDGAIDAAQDKLYGTDQVARYPRPLQNLAQNKLVTLLKDATVSIKISASSSQRANEIARNHIPAMAPFAREGSNQLVPANNKSYPLILMPQEAAALWNLPSDSCRTPRIIWSTNVQAPMPSTFREGTSGVHIGKNTYQGRSESVLIPYADRPAHVNIIGKTIMGKSTLMHNMTYQDIVQNKGVGLVDPHGKLANDILATSIPQYRESDVILFDINDVDYPVGLNLLEAPLLLMENPLKELR